MRIIERATNLLGTRRSPRSPPTPSLFPHRKERAPRSPVSKSSTFLLRSPRRTARAPSLSLPPVQALTLSTIVSSFAKQSLLCLWLTSDQLPLLTTSPTLALTPTTSKLPPSSVTSTSPTRSRRSSLMPSLRTLPGLAEHWLFPAVTQVSPGETSPASRRGPPITAVAQASNPPW